MEVRFPQIFANLVSQWLSNPTNIPTFAKDRNTFLCHDVIPVTYSDLIQQAIADQTAIGWLQATHGFLAKTWMSVASLSYDTKKSFPGQMKDTSSDKSSKLYINSRTLFGPDTTRPFTTRTSHKVSLFHPLLMWR